MKSWYSKSMEVSNTRLASYYCTFPNLPLDLIAMSADVGSSDVPRWLKSSDICSGVLWLAAAAPSRFGSFSRCKCAAQCFCVCVGLWFRLGLALCCPKSICNFPRALTFRLFFCFVFFCPISKVYIWYWHAHVTVWNNILNNNLKECKCNLFCLTWKLTKLVLWNSFTHHFFAILPQLTFWKPAKVIRLCFLNIDVDQEHRNLQVADSTGCFFSYICSVLSCQHVYLLFMLTTDMTARLRKFCPHFNKKENIHSLMLVIV